MRALLSLPDAKCLLSLPHVRSLLAIGLAGTTAACASSAPLAAPPVEAPPPVQLPASEHSLYARILAMADARRADSLLIEEALAASGSAVRRAATLSIGQVRARSMAPRLHVLLFDRDTSVAATAAYALGLLRDSSGVVALDSVLGGPPTVAAEAAWALGVIGSDEAHATIERRLAERTLAGEPLRALILAATRLRPAPVELLKLYLGSEDPEIAWRAAYAMGRDRSPAAVRPLSRTVLARDHRIREQAARALTRAAAGDSLDEEALASLDLFSVLPHPHIRINAIQSIATYGERGRTAVLAAVRDPDPNVRVAAARVLPDVMNRDLARWAWLWNVDTLHAYRRAVLEGAVRMGVLLPGLGEWSTSPDWRDRAAVAAAVAGGESAQAMSWLRSLLTDADPRVRAAAISAFARHADSTAAGRRALAGAATDSSPFVRAAVLEALARRAEAADASLAVARYLADTGDESSQVRVAALRLISAAWRRDSAAFRDTLLRHIGALPAPSVPRERLAARGVTPLAGWPSVEPQARPQAWYEDVVRTLVEPALHGTLPVIEIRTEKGVVVLELFPDVAPLTVHNFLELARSGFYRGTNFHRVVPNFVAQDGDPRGDARAGPGYTIRDELNRRRYGRGVVGMALSGPDTGGSQYFITHSPQPHLDGGYTVFGRVREGMDVVDAIVQGDRITEVVVR